MNCETILRQLPLLPYGELSFDEEEQVHQHLEICAACRAELTRVERLHAACDTTVLEPDATLLADNRRALRRGVAALLPRPRFAWLSLLLKPAGAVALVALGFFGARLAPPPAAAPFEPVASRVRYVEPNNQGQVQIVLEETRQRVMSGDMQDAGIRRLLLAAARESSDPGVRVETMDLLKSQGQSVEVRRALLHAVQHDTNAGVRLKALEGLRNFASDEDTRRVLAQVLLTDTNPGVRTQAVDLLTASNEPDIVGVLQELMAREENNYVRLKCQKALHEMNASVETF